MERTALAILLPRRTSALQQVPWRWWHVLVGLAPLLFFRALQALISAGVVPPAPTGLRLPLSLVGELWMLGWPLYIAWRFRRAPRLPSAEVAITEAVIAVPTWVVMFVTLLMVAIFVRVVAGRFEPPVNQLERMSGLVSHFEMILFALTAVVLAPLGEETLFRGLLYNALRQRMPLFLAIPIQGLVFGFLHSYNLTHSVFASLLGIALALVYEWRRTLVTSMFLHAMQNGIAVLFTALLLALAADNATLGVYSEADPEGCRVAAVIPGSAAEDAGLRMGDIITAVDSQPATDDFALANLVKIRRPGDIVVVEFRRDGEAHRVEAKLKRKGW